MRHLLFFLLFLSAVLSVNSQTINIKGTVIDKSNKEAVEAASVRILNQKDSTYVTGSSTNSSGAFSVNVKSGNYIVSVSFLGYSSIYKNVTPATANVGIMYLGEDAHLLKEAVVTGKAVEVKVNGDTIEYNADAYKTQPSAVVEDLIKKIPGATVGTDGSITVNGKTIQKILVDGKEFFSNDPKIASKNLPASMVQKLQVLDRKSDMSQMTGFDDGNDETVINLQVRPGMKEGLFGNAYAGYGSNKRYEANAMANYMKDNNQYTFIGGLNNTNNAGFSDFASSMFGNNRPPRGISFGNNNGITVSKNGGFNFSSDLTPKLTLGGNARYGNLDNNVISNSYTQNFLSTGNQYTTSKSTGDNKSQNLGLNLRMDWKPDSLTRVIFTPTLQYNTNDNYQTSNAFTTKGNDTINTSKTLYDANGHGTTLGGQMDISRRLNAKGRTLSATFIGGLTNSNSNGLNNSATTYPTDVNANTNLMQNFTQKDDSRNWSGFVSYVEPLNKTNFLQLTYKYANTHSESDKNTNDSTGVVAAYTRNLTTDFQTHNVSLNYKIVGEKYNFTVGIGLEPSKLNVNITSPDSAQVQSVAKTVTNFAPNAQFNYYWSKMKNLRIDYQGSSSQPSSSQLTDGIPSGTTQTLGNADLKPSFQHNLRLRFRNFNPKEGSAMFMMGNFSYTLNDIVSMSNVNSNTGQRLTTYTNVNGDFSGNVRGMINQPVFNKLFSISNMAALSYTRSKSFINSDQNISKNYTISENPGINYRSDLMDLSMRGNFTYQNILNSLKGQTNQSTYTYGGYADATLYLPANFSFDSDVTYSTNSGYSSGFKQNQWLWNMSLSKSVMKNKAGTIQVKIYDILNQRQNISRTASSESISDSFTNGISRYFMVHFVYKFQLFKGGMKQSDMDLRGAFGGHYGHPR